MKNHFKEQALIWANQIRNANGLPSVDRLERGMLGGRNGIYREDQCPLARTIGQSEIFLLEAHCYNKRVKVPKKVSIFLFLHDRHRFPELVTYKPIRKDLIDHLDFAPTSESVLVYA